jgi:hypothetical protein
MNNVITETRQVENHGTMRESNLRERICVLFIDQSPCLEIVPIKKKRKNSSSQRGNLRKNVF